MLLPKPVYTIKTAGIINITHTHKNTKSLKLQKTQLKYTPKHIEKKRFQTVKVLAYFINLIL